MQAEMVLARCHCCDTTFSFPKKILEGMKMPATFCRRCFDIFPLVALRKWFVLDMLYQQLQQLNYRMSVRGI
jgi:hypothetical protein